MIKTLATEHSVGELCELYGVSASGYYAWLNHKGNKRQALDQSLCEKIRQAYADSRKTYGSPRITKALQRQQIRCGKNRVARLMKENGLRGAQKARYRPKTTDSKHNLPVSPNRLLDLPKTIRINQAWVTDITYIPTLEGWMYLAAYMDIKSRKIKGWAIREHMRSELVESAFLQALFREQPKEGLIVHSDRGSQYASYSFRDLLAQNKALSSMAGKGNCYDNAAMESFWATLKTDLNIIKPFRTKEAARLAIFDYIEVFYNRQRIHSAIGDVSPLDYELKSVA